MRIRQKSTFFNNFYAAAISPIPGGFWTLWAGRQLNRTSKTAFGGYLRRFESVPGIIWDNIEIFSLFLRI
jgi:hypothetical protein